jgi:hypothetical protein
LGPLCAGFFSLGRMRWASGALAETNTDGPFILRKRPPLACQLPDSGIRNIDSLRDQQILPVLSRELLVRVTGQLASKTSAQIRMSYCEDEGIAVEFDAAPEVTA